MLFGHCVLYQGDLRIMGPTALHRTSMHQSAHSCAVQYSLYLFLQKWNIFGVFYLCASEIKAGCHRHAALNVSARNVVAYFERAVL
jgi:hypothetical protein